MTGEKKIKKKLGRPREHNTWTAALLLSRARRYFEKCDSHQPRPEPYSIEGLCVYLDITRREFEEWRKAENAELRRRAELIHLAITANHVTGGIGGSFNSNFTQFVLKNTDPEYYRDKIEVENTVDESTKSLLERSLDNWKIKN